MKSYRFLYISLFLFRMGFGQVFMALPLYLNLLRVNPSSIGLVAAANPTGEILLAMPLGKLSDRLGRKNVIGAGLVSSIVLFFAFPFSSSVFLVSLLHMFLGMAEAATIAPSMALITDYEKRRQGFEFGLLNASIILGYVLGPIFAGVLFERSFFLPFLASGATSATAFLLLLFFVEDAPKRKEEKILPFSFVLRMPSMWLILFLWIYAASIVSVVMTFFPIHFATNSIKPSAIGKLLSAMSVSLALSLVVSGWAADRFSKKRLVSIAFLVSSAGMLGVALFPRYDVLFLFTTLLGVGGGMFAPSATAWLASVGSMVSAGMLMGIFDLVLASGNATGPLLAGLLAEKMGLQGVFLLFAFLTVCMAGVVYMGKED